MWYSSVCPLLIKCLPCGLYLKEKPDATVRNLASLCLRYPLSTYSACIIQAIGGLHFGGLYHLAGGIPGGTSDKKKIHMPTREMWVQSLGWEDHLE